jgi:hypothetical protein
MKKHLLKTLLVGVMTLMATSAWAGEKTVVKYSFDDATSPALTAGSRTTLDYSHTSVVTNTAFLNATNNANGQSGATDVALTSTDLTGETWTLTFEWAGNGGCNGKTGHTILKAGDTNLFDIEDVSNWNTTVTLKYGADGTATIPIPACNKSNRFTTNTPNDYNKDTYWHHFVITGSASGVKLTVTNSKNGEAIVTDAVLSETNVTPTAISITPSCGGAVGIDELLLTYYVEGEVIQTPIANYTKVDGISRTITATCDTEGATLYFSTDGEIWIEGAEVTVSDSGKLYFKAVKGTSESDVLEFDAVAGEAIVLNAPVINRTSNTSVTITADQSNLLLSPDATIYYEYGSESGSFTGSMTLTVEADATITAYAEATGYTTSETSERAVALFPIYVEQIENTASKTSGWSANAFSGETITASERTYAALLLDDVQWGQNIYLQTNGAWGLRATGNWYINSATEESWILMQNMKKGDIIVVNVTYPASSTVNATYSKYSFGTQHAYEVAEDGNVELAFQKPDASTMDYLYGVYAYREIEVNPKNIFLKPAIWDVEETTERYAAYAFNSSSTFEWFDFAATEEEGIFTAAVPDFYNNIILVRMNGEAAENNWDNKWNQTDDIDFTAIADNTLFTITGWGEGDGAKSTYETSEYEKPVLNTYTYSFVQDLNGWTTIDADGDGNTWYLLINKDNTGADGNPGLVTSASYASKALTPDNYLVSPKMKLDGKITFFANAQDASYPAEHFGVAVSTTSGTDAADFQMATEEWEMAAARAHKAPRRVQGTWYKYEVDLSSFAGAEGYVAIRHYNCTDWFRLNVDDITLETSQLIDPYDPELEEPLPEPEVVVLPDDAEVFEYNMAYIDPSSSEEASKPINVAVVGNEVYFQGMSQYLPEAWVKGTLEGSQVTFAANQLMGTYGAYGESYFFYNGEAVFTYDAEADTYSATGEIYGVLGGQYYDGRYKDPVLNRVTEVAGVPATPTISGIEETTYGDVVDFNIPLVDVNGNAMLASKLSYQFFVDNEDTPLVFTTAYFDKLTEDMTVIPYGFTDNYDFYDNYIYLNMPHDTWVRLGMQTIYTGGGEENKSEIFWYDMPVKAQPVEAPADLATELYIFKSDAWEYNKNGDVEHPDYTLQVQVGFDGDDAYIQGLAADMPELWVKATKNGEGQYVIPANQYMGELSYYGYTFPYYWTALDAENNLVDAVLNYDAETGTFSTEQTLALNGAADALDYYLLFPGVTITKFVEVAATPATPTLESFNLSSEVGYTSIYASVPAVDTEGNELNTSKLFYTVWYEKDGEQKPYTFAAALYTYDFDEDVTEVPYTYDGYDIYKGGEIIYLEDELAELQSWTNVGIQSIYYGAGERRVSPIAWNILAKGDPTGDGEITTSDAVLTVSFALEIETPTEKQFAAADYNNSNDITVSDAVGIVNEALGVNSSRGDVAPARMLGGDNYLTLNGKQLMLVNSMAFVAFQMDVTLDNGAVLNGVKLSERAAGLSVRYNKVGENTWRIIAMSMQNNAISGNEGTLLSLDITGQCNVTVNGVEFTDAAACAYKLGSVVTGINSISIDTTNADIFNVNGVRTNTMHKGMNIIRNANGEVKKVLVK